MTRVPRPKESSGIIPYEQRLDSDFNWALLEGSMHFDESNSVHKTLRRIAHRLDELGVPYAVAGGMAMYFHGYRRFTEDVDILVTKESLQTIHTELEGRGYLPPFSGSKNLRDTEHGVKIEFLITGNYPGDGKPKPIAFPDPAAAHVVIDGVSFLNLQNLVELKLASGMLPHRLKDLADVQELIRILLLPEAFADLLNPFVQPLFRQMWDAVNNAPKGPDQE